MLKKKLISNLIFRFDYFLVVLQWVEELKKNQ